MEMVLRSQLVGLIRTSGTKKAVSDSCLLIIHAVRLRASAVAIGDTHKRPQTPQHSSTNTYFGPPHIIHARRHLRGNGE